MGGRFSSDESFGRIAIRTEREQYVAGEQVNGVVELQLRRAFPSNQIHLGLVGEESVAVVLAGGGGTDPTGGRVALHTDTLPLFELRFPLFAASGDAFAPGQHSFPFVFRLRDELPGSFLALYDENGQQGRAAVTYTVWAGLRDEQTGTAFFAEKELRVRQRPRPVQGAQRFDFARRVRGYCCTSLGQLSTRCQIDADTLTAGRETLLSVEIDNSNCHAAVRAVQCRLVRTVQLRTSDGKASKTLREDVFSQALQGCGAGERREGVQAQLVRVQLDAGAQPSTQGKLVQCDWAFELEPEFDAFLCCDQQLPHAIAVTLVSAPPPAQPALGGADWAPVSHPPLICSETPDHLFSLRNAP